MLRCVLALVPKASGADLVCPMVIDETVKEEALGEFLARLQVEAGGITMRPEKEPKAISSRSMENASKGSDPD